MPAVNSHLAVSGRLEKLPAGPMIGPIPGPTPDTVLAAPLSAVIQSRPQSVRASASAAMVMVKKNEKVRIERTMSSSRRCRLYCCLITARGCTSCSRLALSRV
ncbi:hypothetical protein D3C86_1831800 [compost metagenome]